jgi:HAD superfamily phosphoserine phosphatase-like hydrolase
MLINVYDFDDTIYRGDSSFDFYMHCRNKYPRVRQDVFGSVPLMIDFAIHRRDKTRSKQRFYRYFTFVPDMEREIAEFWGAREGNLKQWYLGQKRADDLIISASPEFLLKPVCDRLGVALIASRVDPKTGVYDGTNCHGEEKVRRLRAERPEVEIDRFYSDSRSDTPLARLAREAFLVTDDEIKPFPFV